MKKYPALLALLVAAALTLAACGSDDDQSGAGGAADSGTAKFNEADVKFAQDMIPHHEQAVQMAQLADGRAASAEVKELARDIEAAQAPEIDQMRQWLESWGEDVPSESMDHGDMGHDSPAEMPGMMDADELDELAQARGAEWDEMFLTQMIEHHEGAIEMARTERADGENPDALALAEKVEKDQQAEISTMESLLAS
jgi:uncharacterized protein (DUF305 family)